MAGLTLDEFWRCTPYELSLVLSAYAERQEKVREMAAWHACNLMNMWSKRRIRMHHLIKKRGVVSLLDFDSPEEAISYIEEVRADG